MFSFAGFYFAFFFAVFGIRPYLIRAYQLDARLGAIWESNSPAIHAIAQKRACRDGSLPLLANMENEGDLTTYSLKCPESTLTNITDSELTRRDTVTTLCTTSCNQVCYHPADYNPDPKDCGNATAALNTRNSNWNVAVGETTVVQWKTCLYTFTNQAHNTINFCDTAWGSIGNSIAWTCGRWLSDPAKGGICTTTDFYVEAIRTPNMPGPSYTLVHSTGATIDLDPTDTDGVSIASASPQSSDSITATDTDTSVPGQASLDLSTVAVQSLPGAPVVTALEGQGIGSNSTASTLPQTSHQVNTAAIVGGTIGGLAFLVLIVALVLVYRRLKQQRVEHGLVSATEYSEEPYPRHLPWGIPTRNYTSEKRGEQIIPPVASGDTSQNTRSPPQSNTSGSVISAANPGQATFHPRSTEALIAAAAPPNMSREQIDQLTANFVSLVRGRYPQSEFVGSDAPIEPPPTYHGI